MNKASEHFIDALYYYEMYESPACWKTVSVMNMELKRLGSKSAKLGALKDNIKIRVLGLGWSDLATPQSRNGRDLLVKKLANDLKE